jgi:hypothetical protein
MSTLQDYRLFPMCFTRLKERCNKVFLYDITRNIFGHNNYEKILQKRRNIKFYVFEFFDFYKDQSKR